MLDLSLICEENSQSKLWSLRGRNKNLTWCFKALSVMQCWLIVVHFARSSCSPDLLWLRLQSKHAVQSSWLNAYLIIAKINCQKHWFPTKHCAHTMSTFLQFYPSLPYFSVQNFFFPGFRNVVKTGLLSCLISCCQPPGKIS